MSKKSLKFIEDIERSTVCDIQELRSSAAMDSFLDSAADDLLINKSNNDLWNSILDHLLKRYGKVIFNNWFKDIVCKGVEDDILVIVTPTKFIRELILGNYLSFMIKHLQSINEKVGRIDVRVAGDNSVDAALDNLGQHKAKTSFSHLSTLSLVSEYSKQRFAGSKLDSSYTFREFVCGAENKVAYFAAKQIAGVSEHCKDDYNDEPDGVLDSEHANKKGRKRDSIELDAFRAENLLNSSDSLNKLYVHSDVGMGKTHLLQAIAHHMKGVDGMANVVYFTAEKFMRQYIEAVKQNTLIEFKNKLCELDCLLLDDLQLICGRSGTEREFIATFDALIELGKKVVIAADRPSYALEINKRAKSRLSGCVSVHIENPDFALRLKILKHKARSIAHQPIDHEILELIASNVDSSVRELEAMLHRVVTYSHILDLPIDLRMCRRLVREYLQYNDPASRVPENTKAELTAEMDDATSDVHKRILRSAHGGGAKSDKDNKGNKIETTSQTRDRKKVGGRKKAAGVDGSSRRTFKTKSAGAQVKSSIVDLHGASSNYDGLPRLGTGRVHYSESGKLLNSKSGKFPHSRSNDDESLENLRISEQSSSELILESRPTQDAIRDYIEKLLDVVARHFEVSVDDLLSKSRAGKVLIARQVAVFLLKKFSSLTLKDIGLYIGDRNYSTIIHLLKSFEKNLNSDSGDDLYSRVSLVKEELSRSSFFSIAGGFIF